MLVELSGGVATDRGAQARTLLAHRNIGGLGHRVSLLGQAGYAWAGDGWRLDLAAPVWKAALRYEAPNLPARGQRLVADVVINEVIQEPTFRTSDSGASLGVRVRLSARSEAQISYGGRLRRLEDVDPGALVQGDPWLDVLGLEESGGQELDLSEARRVLTGPSAALVLDRRDDPLDPARGWRASGLISVSDGLISAPTSLRAEGRIEQLLPLGRAVLALSGSGGLGLASGSGSTLAVEERFYLGGTGSLRGFRPESVGPANLVARSDPGFPDGLEPFISGAARPADPSRWVRTGGDILLAGSAELRLPLSLLGLSSFSETALVASRTWAGSASSAPSPSRPPASWGPIPCCATAWAAACACRRPSGRSPCCWEATPARSPGGTSPPCSSPSPSETSEVPAPPPPVGPAARRPARRPLLGLLVGVALLLSAEGLTRLLAGPPLVPVVVRMPDGSEGLFEGEPLRPKLSEHAAWWPAGPKDPARPRIVMLGGSSLAGPPHDARLAANQLAAILDAEVVNLGVGGMDSGHLLAELPGVAALEPDLVIVYSGHNDLGNAVFSRRFAGRGAVAMARARQVLGHSRIFELLEASWRGQEEKQVVVQWDSRDMALGEAEKRAVLADFERRMDALLDGLVGLGAPVLLSTVASNAFFPSVHWECPERLARARDPAQPDRDPPAGRGRRRARRAGPARGALSGSRPGRRPPALGRGSRRRRRHAAPAPRQRPQAAARSLSGQRADPLPGPPRGPPGGHRSGLPGGRSGRGAPPLVPGPGPLQRRRAPRPGGAARPRGRRGAGAPVAGARSAGPAGLGPDRLPERALPARRRPTPASAGGLSPGRIPLRPKESAATCTSCSRSC
jgi:hypothetical protein